MPDADPRPGTPALIALGCFCAVVIAASAIRFTGAELDGRLGFAFFLLVMVTPVFIAAELVVSLWRVMSHFLPRVFGVPERMLFALAVFVIFCGSGPLVISLAVMEVTRREGSVGAAGMWAVVSIAASAGLCVFGFAVTVGRLALQRGVASQ